MAKEKLQTWVIAVAVLLMIAALIWVDINCDQRARLLGGKGYPTRDMGCVVEMPDGTLRRPQ